jgi:hypothetical protein
LFLCIAAAGAGSQRGIAGLDRYFGYLSNDAIGYKEDVPEAEFRMARVKYFTRNRAGSRGISQPMWAVDYPQAEEHLFDALRRVTNIQVAQDSIHLELSDDRIFRYPFLFLQQPGGGNWRPTDEDASNLREHLLRGGFLMVDDFHGEFEWERFQTSMGKVFPDREFVEIPIDDPLMHIFFDLDKNNPIPGDRHLYLSRNGQVGIHMEGPPRWRGMYDDHRRLMVAANLNMDMGDAWEHADDPYYPGPMTALAYKFAINYVIYAMTH